MVPARRELTYNLYFQDKFQVSSKLTLDLGLRCERERGSRPRFNGGLSNYNPVSNTLEIAGVGAVPFVIANANNNFGPRLGILPVQRQDGGAHGLRHQLLCAPHGSV